MARRGRKAVARAASLSVGLGAMALLLSGCSWSEVLGLGWPEGITPEAHLNRELWIGSLIAALWAYGDEDFELFWLYEPGPDDARLGHLHRSADKANPHPVPAKPVPPDFPR